jgi:excisionase family DNA binding protein
VTTKAVPRGSAEPTPVAAYSIAQLEKALGVSNPTLYAEMNRGRLDSVRIGSRRLVTQRQLDAYLRLLEEEKKPKPAEVRERIRSKARARRERVRAHGKSAKKRA